MSRRPLPAFLVEAVVKAAQSNSDWEAELKRRRLKAQQARSITAQMRKEYQLHTILPEGAGEAPEHANTPRERRSVGASSSGSHTTAPLAQQQQRSEGHKMQDEEKEETQLASSVSRVQPAASPLAPSSSSLPATFLDWKAKRTAASASAGTAKRTTAPPSSTATAKQPHSKLSAASDMPTAATTPTAATSRPAPPPPRTATPARQPAPAAAAAGSAGNASTARDSTAAHRPTHLQPKTQQSSAALPACPQGANCTRQNATHRANFSHSAAPLDQSHSPTSLHATALASESTRRTHSQANKGREEEEAEAEERKGGWHAGGGSSAREQQAASKKRLRRLDETEMDESEQADDARMDEEDGEDRRAMPQPVCPYGAHCYRVNPVHLRQYAHQQR